MRPKGRVLLQAGFGWDPASLADEGVTSGAITPTGAVPRDFVDLAAPYDLQGVTATAYVAGADTIRIRLQNETGATKNLGSGVWLVRVEKG